MKTPPVTVSRRWLFAAVALGAVLRTISLGKFSLGNDEIAEVSWARLPWSEMWRTVSHDAVHPPLDYIVQFLLARTAAPELVLRLPSVVAGIVTIALLGALATKWFGSPAGAAAAFLLAISPTHIRFSQEIRPYSIALMLLVAAILALESYRETKQMRFAVGWAAALWLSAAWLYFAGLIAALVSLAILLAHSVELRRVWKWSPLIGILGFALYSPWFPVIFRAAGAAPPAAREALSWNWWSYRFQVLATGDWLVEPVALGSWIWWGFVVMGMVLAFRRRETHPAAIWLLVGMALQIAILQVRPHYPAARHLLPAWLGAFPLAGAAVAAIALRSRALTGVLLFAIAAFSGVTLRAYYHHGRPEWKKAVRYIQKFRAPGDAVYSANGWTAQNFNYYWRELGENTQPARVPPGGIVEGPAWIVITACPMSEANRTAVERLPLRRSLPYTSRCELRYVPPGERLNVEGPLCLYD